MKIYSPTLFIEIKNKKFTYLVGDVNEQSNFNLIYKSSALINGIENSKITDFDSVFSAIKKNIFLIEQELNFTFKNTILIIDNFNSSFISLTGFKKLNRSQILKENIPYILNSLKSNVDEIEKDKTILHIFNTQYYLDKKKIENLPIGLFGDFYSHELSFCLINKNDYMSLKNIFNKCNLKIDKILLKSFVEGSHISSVNLNVNTFFKIKIDRESSQIFYFENNSLKFEENFNFGSDLILKDISKVTSLKIDVVEKIVRNSKLSKEINSEELIEKIFFNSENHKTIKKKLIQEIASARIEEFLEILLFKNINLKCYKKLNIVVFLNINDKFHFNCFKDVYHSLFSDNNNFAMKFSKDFKTEDTINTVNQIVHFGWKKEAIPIVHRKKSLIAKIFNAVFG